MLDPKRIGLNAESIGFQKRMRQDVDYNAFQVALQTDYNNQGSAVQVRREKATPVSEIHIMGGERAGFQSNDLMKTIARQERQLNGYPLRHFDAANPAVMLPKKYGGFPMYNRNQTEYPELVSVFTEPMSAPLQRNTELLGRMGAVAMSNSMTTPYAADGFIDPMTRTYDSLQQNQNEFKQRRHLQNMSERSRSQKFNVPTGPTGVFISKNGQPMSGVSDQITDELVERNTFGDAQRGWEARAAMNQNQMGGVAGDQQIVQGGDDEIDLMLAAGWERELTAARNANLDNQGAVTFVNADQIPVAYLKKNFLAPKTLEVVSIQSPQSEFKATPNRGPVTGMQAGNLSNPLAPMTRAPYYFEEGLPAAPSTKRARGKRGKVGRKYTGQVKENWIQGGTVSAEEYNAAKRVNRRINYGTPGMHSSKRLTRVYPAPKNLAMVYPSPIPSGTPDIT